MTPQAPDLAPYAISDRAPARRDHPEPTDARRTPFQIDHHRVVHSAAFRRLEYKTQVFVIHEGDHFRTRLTHTLEVASAARLLAGALGANAELAEVIALAHDLGHPPFGHAGEKELDAFMSEHGGFEHNAQSLRVVEYLEHPYPAFRGLNLTAAVHEGLAGHATRYDQACAGGNVHLEGQIVSWADRLAYDLHDLEDGLGSGLIDADQLGELRLWQMGLQDAGVSARDHPVPAIRRPVLDAIESRLMDDIATQTRHRLTEHSIQSPDDLRSADVEMVACGTLAEPLAELEDFLLRSVYRHHRVVRMDAKSRRVLTDVLSAYLDEPRLLPPRFAERIDEQGPHRVICDYVAGMTDRFCQREYRRLFEPFEPV
jgi:dGTPase